MVATSAGLKKEEYSWMHKHGDYRQALQQSDLINTRRTLVTLRRIDTNERIFDATPTYVRGCEGVTMCDFQN